MSSSKYRAWLGLTAMCLLSLFLSSSAQVLAQAPKDPKGKAPAKAPTGQDLSQWLVKGSYWAGWNYQIRPKKLPPGTVGLIITERNGDTFKAEMLLGGRHLRYVVGTVNGNKIEWSGAQGQAKPGAYNVGTINGKRMEIKYYPAKVSPETELLGTAKWEFEPVNVAVADGTRQKQLENAAGKILGAALFHAIADKAAEDPDAGFGKGVFILVALQARDAAIESAVRDVFPRLATRQSKDISLLITRAIDGRLEFADPDEKAAKKRLINDLRQIDPDLGDAAMIADFIYSIHQGRPKR